jgi:uncharacterized protein YyaL (SSP411 family)
VQLLEPAVSFNGIAWDDLRKRPSRVASDMNHLEATLRWLSTAHDRAEQGGVSYGYSLRGGWLPPYRETSGYILTTFYRVAEALGRTDYAERAERVADWLITVQNSDGGFANPKYGPEGIVFDTGQCLFGLVAAYMRTHEARYLEAAIRAGDWLVSALRGEPMWRSSEYKGTPHTYNTRTAWALLRLNLVAPRSEFVDAARRNLDWAVGNQADSGFFRHNAFKEGDVPYTHNISYAICGLQESGWILGDSRYVDAARRCSDAALSLMRPDGFIPGQVTVEGRAAGTYSCLTGQAQLAVAWFRQFQETGVERYRDAARRSLGFVKRHHRLDRGKEELQGAVAGSYPVWGRYAPFSFPNWAAKFFVDALLLESAC